MSARAFGGAAALVVAAIAAGCSSPTNPNPSPSPSPKVSANALPSARANAAHGKEIVVAAQCNRCHAGTGDAPPPQEKDCVGCHASIVGSHALALGMIPSDPALSGGMHASPATLAKWAPRVRDYVYAPSLEALGKRTTRAFVASYLRKPTDQRPHLAQSMPRLALSDADIRDVAAYLVPDDDGPADLAHAPELAGADLGRGRALLEGKGCATCHAFTGVAELAVTPLPALASSFVRGHALAPDLRLVRERTTPAKLVAWLRDPQTVKPDTAMPKIDLTETELRDVAAYLLLAEVAPRPSPQPVTRLPVLTRKVTFKEVDEKVFHRTCWHCHSEPDYAIGDGGPGNSGGFGFKPRGVNLASYAGVSAGFLDDHGERSSIFAKDAAGVPRLVRALVARHEEEQGGETGEVRGMPLGYPPLPLEEIQLVETWIAQGRPK